ncbi:restriction endonuclease subunit S [Phocaeicola vulgatus]|uniref:restriction endonuclease subunit S n=1 Tax=Phocaeicola vulgatus TaxID=821 RepID=UPI000E5C1F52|nr:restriction endonuclease subunit S [Phocaeicola vulgatus]RIB32694.1 type I restriction modification DNA specificity domain protein [Phocaeicola vulgatus]USS68142.1 Type I restriction modification DNA specificity domain protein [Phocaeicola vulgatus]
MSSYYEKMFATGEVKCIDEEVQFEIPKGWEWCRLNDLALYRKGPFGSSLTKSMFVAKSNQSVKVYEQKNAIQKDFRLGDYYISKEKFEAMQSFIVKPNDIIVSCAGTIGETYLLPLDAPVGIINQALMRVTLFDLSMAEYWQMYFAYMLLNEAQMKGAGSAIKNIPPFEYLKAVLVPVPPLSEQSRLVERYNLLLSLIAKYESEADKLNCLNLNIYDKLKKTVLQEAIQGKLVQQIAEEGTAQKLLEQIKTEKQKLVKEGKLKKSALNDSVIFRGDDNKYYEQIGSEVTEIELPFDFPSSWSIARLYAVCQLTDGLKTTGKQCLLDAKYLRGKSSGTIIEQGKLVYKGDNIMLVDGENSGEVFIVPQDGYMGSTFKQLWISSSLYEPYILAFIQFYKETLRNSKKGAAIPHLNKELFYGLIIGIPPFQEQKRIVQKIGLSAQLLK